jgi:Na+/H+ antiporter NhaC
MTEELENIPGPGVDSKTVRYYGGMFGALLPFIIFIIGVIAVALSGAPDERGFWPILVLALSLGLVLARDRKNFCETAIEGMAQPIVMIMLMAWMLASVIGTLMSATGFVEALTWSANQLNLTGATFVLLTFIICCIVSVSTGSSFGTILICGPILYPAGGVLGAHLATLAGAIIGGATFGDSIAPISDTTIAGAVSQKADIGGTVRSRLKYVIPAALIAVVLYFFSAYFGEKFVPVKSMGITGNPGGLPMIIVPVVIIALLLSGRHLVEGLLFGLLTGVVVGLIFGILPVEKIFSLDLEHFTAKSFIIDGINRSIGISVFTILLMGLISTLKASGFIDRLVVFSTKGKQTVRGAETRIFGAVGAAVLLTCHSIVAILTVSEFVNQLGERVGISRYRRANLLSLTVSTFPFILPYFIPVILTANITNSGAEYGIPVVSPLQAGLHNFNSWAVLAIVIFAIVSGFGTNKKKPGNQS